MESEVREVSFEEALAEEEQYDQAPSRPRPAPGQATHAPAPEDPGNVQPPQAPESPPEPAPEPPANSEADQARQAAIDELAVLAPPVASKEWTFGEGDISRTYVQCELSVIGSTQWFALFGEFLDKAMTGDNALSLNALMSPPTPRQSGRLQIQDFQDADMFVHALGKLLTVMPEFLEKSVCIWLDVPDYEWDLVRELMRRSPSRGGMSHDQFEEIVLTFIDQNYGEIDRFFRERFRRLRARYQARALEASQSRSQKR